mmetsp:Transcript_3881/g.7611  ORF Transcript_3881/g.7611 Transcript_3881/m.7611 type:complete len:369 (+) Transcript_3881:248-1354(+)
MGKKSKRKAAARPSAGMTSSSAIQKCANCLSSIKDVPSKGRQCPGCSVLYCWRCERKYFAACANGSDCISPLRRCQGCACGGTFRNVLREKCTAEEREDGTFLVTDSSSLEYFAEFVRTDDKLTVHADPFVWCGASGCHAHECMLCLSDPVPRTLVACSRCKKTRCRDCAFAFRDLPSVRPVLSEAIVEGSWERLWRTAPDGFWKCAVCGDDCCADCIGSSGLKGSAGFILDDDGNARYKCSRCYFAAKPCTNPTCPHEVGVPTKRCGDCRRARYCSKECQRAAYPAHQRECKAEAERRQRVVEGEMSALAEQEEALRAGLQICEAELSFKKKCLDGALKKKKEKEIELASLIEERPALLDQAARRAS